MSPGDTRTPCESEERLSQRASRDKVQRAIASRLECLGFKTPRLTSPRNVTKYQANLRRLLTMLEKAQEAPRKGTSKARVSEIRKAISALLIATRRRNSPALRHLEDRAIDQFAPPGLFGRYSCLPEKGSGRQWTCRGWKLRPRLIAWAVDLARRGYPVEIDLPDWLLPYVTDPDYPDFVQETYAQHAEKALNLQIGEALTTEITIRRLS